MKGSFKMAATKLDIMPEEELADFQAIDNILVSGNAYLWVVTFRWAIVGYYIKHIAPHRILVAHPSFFTTAGRDYASLAREGAGPDCQWRYYGPVLELNPFQVLKTIPYHGQVHRGEPLPGPNQTAV